MAAQRLAAEKAEAEQAFLLQRLRRQVQTAPGQAAPAATGSALVPGAGPAWTVADEQALARKAFLEAQQQQQQRKSSKCEREVYVGNIQPGSINKDQIIRLFNESLTAVFPNCNLPVCGINMHSGGKYCFLEFRDKDLCTAALDLDGFQILGLTLSVKRPASYEAARHCGKVS
ncbi:RRM domain-containing protein [Chloropicon primus]|uniref:RRM domain-containing protein n=1 Tax=Chloropicon primus TaxID=1764295 RepID=A0A5B8MSM1_9CHLO|nr:hypothetical protein A3770_10p58590 [Chloropicon primus]UPR02553.1 RRM domain-containing protein [Chloropicon primus]|eukprot:QDZ23341.1 hypothetical protein A3770_10p58590 [Chloropicon primus]